MVPITPSVRLISDDPSSLNLQAIYEDHCRKNGVNKDEPILFSIDKFRALSPVSNNELEYLDPRLI
jgi:transformation/transcription domain-associated protein